MTRHAPRAQRKQGDSVELCCVVSAEATAADHPAHPYFVARYRRVRTGITEALEHAGRKGALRAGVVPERSARARPSRILRGPGFGLGLGRMSRSPGRNS
ncbi:hypothetical protein [Embleya sp. NPDC059237]|uniref:hypothetical protein n=1 Tax=Embleya sp. NPDC059237 TaxID=3346784 RepID=UPI0036B9D8D0